MAEGVIKELQPPTELKVNQENLLAFVQFLFLLCFNNFILLETFVNSCLFFTFYDIKESMYIVTFKIFNNLKLKHFQHI